MLVFSLAKNRGENPPRIFLQFLFIKAPCKSPMRIDFQLPNSRMCQINTQREFDKITSRTPPQTDQEIKINTDFLSFFFFFLDAGSDYKYVFFKKHGRIYLSGQNYFCDQKKTPFSHSLSKVTRLVIFARIFTLFWNQGRFYLSKTYF